MDDENVTKAEPCRRTRRRRRRSTSPSRCRATSASRRRRCSSASRPRRSRSRSCSRSSRTGSLRSCSLRRRAGRDRALPRRRAPEAGHGGREALGSRAVNRVRERAAWLVAGDERANRGGAAAYAPIRHELLELDERRERELRELGAAVYEGDEEAAERAQERAQPRSTTSGAQKEGGDEGDRRSRPRSACERGAPERAADRREALRRRGESRSPSGPDERVRGDGAPPAALPCLRAAARRAGGWRRHPPTRSARSTSASRRCTRRSRTRSRSEGVLTQEITVVDAKIAALQDDVARAQAELNTLEAQLAASQRRLDRMTELFEASRRSGSCSCAATTAIALHAARAPVDRRVRDARRATRSTSCSPRRA